MFIKSVALVALVAAAMAPTADARWTGNVQILNLMANHTISFLGCNASGKGGDATSTIKVLPQKEIKPQEVGRFYMDTGGIDWSFQGFCWFDIVGYEKDPECTAAKLPGPVTSCPWVGWDREFIPITGTETITWNFETPGHVGIGDVVVGKRIDHAAKVYCICEPGVNCQQACADVN